MANITETLLTDIQHKKDFVKVSSIGDLESISGLDNILGAILRRIMTSPGTLMHRPNYGAGLKDFQNSPTTIATQRELAQRISRQIVQDSRISEVTGVSIETTDRNPEKRVIIVSVLLVGFDEEVTAEIPFGEVF